MKIKQTVEENMATKKDLVIVRDAIDKKLSEFDRMSTRVVTECVNTTLYLEKHIKEIKE
jgi:hypothetical protein